MLPVLLPWAQGGQGAPASAAAPLGPATVFSDPLHPSGSKPLKFGAAVSELDTDTQRAPWPPCEPGTATRTLRVGGRFRN